MLIFGCTASKCYMSEKLCFGLSEIFHVKADIKYYWLLWAFRLNEFHHGVIVLIVVLYVLYSFTIYLYALRYIKWQDLIILIFLHIDRLFQLYLLIPVKLINYNTKRQLLMLLNLININIFLWNLVLGINLITCIINC